MNDELFTPARDTPMSPMKKTKRSVGYGVQGREGMVESARFNLKRMRIDERTE